MRRNSKKWNSRLRSFTGSQGFALPLVIGMGLLIILIALTLFMRSQTALISASARQASAQGLSSAEAGVTLIQSFLDLHRFLGITNSGTPTSTTGWVNDLQTRSLKYINYVGFPCPEIIQAKTAAENYLGGTTIASGEGKFRIVNYTTDPPSSSIPPLPLPDTYKGVLTIEGAPNNQNALVGSLARVRVEIPIDESPPPTLWGSGFNLVNDNLIIGDIRAYACPSGIGSTGASGTNNVVSDTNIVAGSGNLKIDPYQVVPEPLNPPSWTGVYNINEPLPSILPRGSDNLADDDGNYHYSLTGQITSSGSPVISIDGTKILPDKGINIYVGGNIDLSSVTVNVTGGLPGRRFLRILGQSTTTSVVLDAATSLPESGSELIVLIHTPQATATLSNTGGTGGTGITGALWAKNIEATIVPGAPKTWLTRCSSCTWNDIWNNTAPSTQRLLSVRLSPITAWATCTRTSDPPPNNWERLNTSIANGSYLACNGS